MKRQRQQIPRFPATASNQPMDGRSPKRPYYVNCSRVQCTYHEEKLSYGSQITRMREARRIQRMQFTQRENPSPATSDDSTPPPCPPPQPPTYPTTVDKALQNRVILHLALKTVALVQKNRLIQEKILALQKETREYVATIMKNPENRRRYLEHIRVHGVPESLRVQVDEENLPPVNTEPKA
ncbi:hypothetical protein ACJJTC_016929 [Scirpophaga incertulas]